MKPIIIAIVLGLSWSAWYVRAEEDSLSLPGETPLSHYAIIEERNFFRPLDPAALVPAVPVVDHSTETSRSRDSDLILTGVVALKGSLKAIIESNRQGNGYYVTVGDYIENYEVITIQEQSVTLRNDGELIELHLEKPPANQISPVGVPLVPVPTPSEALPPAAQLSPGQKIRMGRGGQ